MAPPRAILIAGPTASGKSALALALAERLGGTVINADSMQVYCELRVLTARPTPEEAARAPHRLYGHVPAREAYSVGRWLVDVQGVLAEARAAARVPILVGGTGLYFKALLEGLAPIPDVPEEVRAHWRAEAKRLGGPALHGLLAARDPRTAAGLSPSDPQRLVRALEVLDATGRGLAAWQRRAGTPLLTAAQTVRLVLAPERGVLYPRIDARFEAMLRAGALGEVERLSARGLDRALPAMRAHGVGPLAAHLRGEIDLETAVKRAQTDTRRYAKRQLTWARRNMIAWQWHAEQDMECLAAEFFAFIDA